MNGRRLYEEIGYVDERYLQEAATYRARKKSPAWRALLIAAALLLSFALLLGTVAAGVTIGVIGALINSGEQEPEPLAPIAQMEQAMAGEQHASLSAEQLDFFGRPTLIWSELGSDEYHSVMLSTYECNDLVYLMQTDRREYTAQSDAPKYQIWLCFGDGVVVSPYLKNTPGNAARGEVFDYDPELEMSDDLAEYIAECIGS